MIETNKKAVLELEAELSSNLNQSMNINKNEMDLRTKIDELNSKILKNESVIRESKEECYLVSTENTNLKSDLKNLSNMERALRTEINSLMQQRHELEDTLQRVKVKISQDSLKIRKFETENESLNRQIMSMENTISIASKEVDDMKNENLQLKEILNSKERENIFVKKTLERKETDLKNANTALNRANSLLDAHQSTIESFENNEQKVENEYRESNGQSNYTQDYSPYGKRSLERPSNNTFMSPYDSPIVNFKRQPQPSQTSAYYPNVQSLTPRSNNLGMSQDMTPERSPRPAKYDVNGTDNKSKVLVKSKIGVEFFESQLKLMKSEKRRLEEEYTKLPIVIMKSPALQRRKEFLEKQLDMLEKNINFVEAKCKQSYSLH